MDYETAAGKESAAKLSELSMDQIELDSPEVGNLLKQLWKEPALKIIYGERDRLFNINDGVGYIFDNLERVYTAGYIPTEEDLLRVRLRTTGADEAIFHYKGSSFHVVDLGGQRSERKKWQRHLEEADTVLFVSSLTEWDQKLREDFSTSRMKETFSLFHDVLNVTSTIDRKKLSLVVLLTKLDLFKEKLGGDRKNKFTAYFTDYRGPLEWESCANYVKRKFFDASEGREIFVHFVVAIATDSVKLVWNDIRTMLLGRAMQSTFNL